MFEANSIWPLVGAPSSRADAEQKLRVNYEKAICSSNFEPKSRAPCAHTAKKQSKVRVCAFQHRAQSRKAFVSREQAFHSADGEPTSAQAK